MTTFYNVTDLYNEVTKFQIILLLLLWLDTEET
jgi:hypothetical protein